MSHKLESSIPNLRNEYYLYLGLIAVKAWFSWLIFFSFWVADVVSKFWLRDCAQPSDDGNTNILGTFWDSSIFLSLWWLFLMRFEGFWVMAWICTWPVPLTLLVDIELQLRKSWFESCFKGSFCILIAGGCWGETTSDDDGVSSLFNDTCGSFVMYCVYWTVGVALELAGIFRLPVLDGTTDITTELLLMIAKTSKKYVSN